MSKILVALSGGLDSAAVVLMLRDKGFQIEALYIDMTGSEESRSKAVELAERLDVRLHIENVEHKFRTQIVDFALSEHQCARTPSPCALCNPQIKWSTLVAVADRLGIEKIATGHYVNIVKRGERFFISVGVDPAKDQSYYLWALDQSVLSRAITPLGALFKRDVRTFLAERGFEALASGGESMGLCFLEGQSYNEFIASHLPISPGEVLNVDGEVMGTHDGFQLYTVGQKRGFRAEARGEVRSIDHVLNRLVVGEPLYATDLILTNCVVNTLDADRIRVKVRGLGRNPEGYASVEFRGDCLYVHLIDDKAWAPAAGQPVVLYSDDILIAGGDASAFCF